MTPKILIAGIGNIFLGDDGFGVEVAQRLARRTMPERVRVVDFGIRGFDLVYALLEDYDEFILVDATPRGGQAGTVYLIEPDLTALDDRDPCDLAVETHGMNPMKVLAMVRAMGGNLKRVLVVGCEPSPSAEYEEERIGLSPAVGAAVDEAVAMVESLVARAVEEHRAMTAS